AHSGKDNGAGRNRKCRVYAAQFREHYLEVRSLAEKFMERSVLWSGHIERPQLTLAHSPQNRTVLLWPRIRGCQIPKQDNGISTDADCLLCKPTDRLDSAFWIACRRNRGHEFRRHRAPPFQFFSTFLLQAEL